VTPPPEKPQSGDGDDSTGDTVVGVRPRYRGGCCDRGGSGHRHDSVPPDRCASSPRSVGLLNRDRAKVTT